MDGLEGMKQIPDNSVDAIVTDPPYGIGFKYDVFKDKTNHKDYWEWFQPFYYEMLRILRAGGFHAIWQSQLYFKHFWDWFGDDIHIYASCKNFVQIRPTGITYAYDPIVMFYKQGVQLRPSKPRRNLDFFVANTANFITKTKNPARKHPCPRPIDQMIEILSNFVVDGGIVLDPFLGSGTLIKACLQTDRIGLGFEINPDYETIIQERIMEKLPPLETYWEKIESEATV